MFFWSSCNSDRTMLLLSIMTSMLCQIEFNIKASNGRLHADVTPMTILGTTAPSHAWPSLTGGTIGESVVARGLRCLKRVVRIWTSAARACNDYQRDDLEKVALGRVMVAKADRADTQKCSDGIPLSHWSKHQGHIVPRTTAVTHRQS